MVLGDDAFEERRCRDKVARTFRRIFSDLTIDQVQVGGDPDFFGAEDGIVFDGDVYEESAEGSNETIVVESDANEYVLRHALYTAALRMAKVGENGHEYTSSDVTEIAGGGSRMNDDALAGEVYTPNYVSNLTFDGYGNPGFYVDCKSVIAPPMAAQFRRILVEEFRKAGIVSAHVRVPTD